MHDYGYIFISKKLYFLFQRGRGMQVSFIYCSLWLLYLKLFLKKALVLYQHLIGSLVYFLVFLMRNSNSTFISTVWTVEMLVFRFLCWNAVGSTNPSDYSLYGPLLQKPVLALPACMPLGGFLRIFFFANCNFLMFLMQKPVVLGIPWFFSHFFTSLCKNYLHQLGGNPW